MLTSQLTSLDITGSTGSMFLEIPNGVTLQAIDGISVGPGGVLKGKGTIVGDIINNGGTVAAGLPEPSTGVLLILGILGVVSYVRGRT